MNADKYEYIVKRKILQTDNEYIVKEEDTAEQIMNIQLKRKILQTDNEYIVKEEDTTDIMNIR